jgi:uncharacterized membrane protein
VTFTTNPPVAAVATSSFGTAIDQAGPVIVPGLLGRAAHIVGDLLLAVGVVLCIPFVILAIGTPIALCVRLLLWIAGML